MYSPHPYSIDFHFDQYWKQDTGPAQALVLPSVFIPYIFKLQLILQVCVLVHCFTFGIFK